MPGVFSSLCWWWLLLCPIGVLGRREKVGILILQLPCILAQLLPWHSGHELEVFAVILFSGCHGGECRDVRSGYVHIYSILVICFFIQTFVSH